MLRIIADWFVNALALFIVSRILTGFEIQNFQAALIAVIIIGLINALIKPLLFILTLPISILTLGLFTFVLNALMLILASHFTPGFKIDGLFQAILGSILLSVVSVLLHSLVR